MTSNFDLKEFAKNNNVTVIELKDNDFVYIQIPKPANTGSKDLDEHRKNVNEFFMWAFKDMKIKHTADYEPLQFTVITKKEEFVARLNDEIVQL